MKKREIRSLLIGLSLLALFAFWTVLICTVDVQAAGETGMPVGFATLNRWFHGFTGVHMTIYYITDWLGLVPVFVCFLFGFFGLAQLIRRGSFEGEVNPFLFSQSLLFDCTRVELSFMKEDRSSLQENTVV